MTENDEVLTITSADENRHRVFAPINHRCRRRRCSSPAPSAETAAARITVAVATAVAVASSSAWPSSFATSRIRRDPLMPILSPPLFLLAVPTFILLFSSPVPVRAAGISDNYYCGIRWIDASKDCSKHCPSGNDSECNDSAQRCHKYTGCHAKVNSEKPTSKPTNALTDPPTPAPTRTPIVEPTSSPITATPTTNAPSMSLKPTPVPTQSSRPYVQDLVSGAGREFIDDVSRAYGAMFDVETSSDAPAMLIRSIDFYTDLVDVDVEYEVWTKEGTWRGSEGMVREFRQIAGGTVRGEGSCADETPTSSAKCRFTSIPASNFTAVPMNGGGDRRAFYVTLSTKHMLYKRSVSTGNQFFVSDQIMHSTPELSIYEGASVLGYPLGETNRPLFYRNPRGFLGRIWYHRDACEPTQAIWPCNGTSRVPGVSAEGVEEVQEAPDVPVVESGNNGTNSSIAPSTNAPSPLPTRSASPSEIETILYYVLTIRNVVNRVMSDEEELHFSKIILTFLRENAFVELNEVDVHAVSIWHQEVLTESEALPEEEAEDDGGGGSTNEQRRQADATAVPPQRRAQEQEGGANETENDADEKEQEPWVLKVTIIISVGFSPLPGRITEDLLRTAIHDDQASLLAMLRDQAASYSYFGSVDSIPSIRSVDNVTPVPTQSPTTNETEAPTSLVVVKDTSLSLVATVALYIGLLWLLLTLSSLSYLFRARKKMTDEQELRVVKTTQFGQGAGDHGMEREMKGDMPTGNHEMEKGMNGYNAVMTGSGQEEQYDDDNKDYNGAEEEEEEYYDDDEYYEDGEEEEYYEDDEDGGYDEDDRDYR